MSYSPYQQAIEHLKNLLMICTDEGINAPEIEEFVKEAMKTMGARG